MGRHTARPRPGRMIPVIGTSCGLLAAAAFTGGMRPLVALPQAGDTSLIMADDSAEAADASAPPADGAPVGGPLDIPRIGVVAPGFDERYAALPAAPPPQAAPSATETLVDRILPAEEPPSPPAPPRAPSPPPPPPPTPPTHPSVTSPPTGDNTREGPTDGKPADETPTGEKPTDQTPTDETPTTGKSTGEKPRDQTPTDETPTTGKSTGEKPTDEKPTDEKPTDEKPTDEKPTNEEAADGKPTVEQPPVDPPPVDGTPARESPVQAPPAEVALTAGESFDVVDAASGAVLFSIAVDRVTADLPCTSERHRPAANGHLVGLDVRVTTGPARTDGKQPVIRPAAFRLVGGPDMVLATESAAACLDAARTFPTAPIDPDQEITGTVVLDVPKATGTIAYRPADGTTRLLWRF